MRDMIDFLHAALPWVAIGLVLIIYIVNRDAKPEQKAKLKKLNLVPVGCALIVAILDITGGKISRGMTWVILAAAFFGLGIINARKPE